MIGHMGRFIGMAAPIGSWVRQWCLRDEFKPAPDDGEMPSMDAPQRVPAGSCVHAEVMGFEFVRQSEVVR